MADEKAADAGKSPKDKEKEQKAKDKVAADEQVKKETE